MQKLRRQAHEAAEKAECLDKSHPGFTELERIGGKTHLISKAGDSPSPSACSKAPPSIASIDTPASATASTSMSPVPVDSIHPTIMHDMRTFEGVGDFQSVFQPPITGTLDITQVFGDHQMQQQSPQPIPTVQPPFESFPDVYLSSEEMFSVPPPPSTFNTDGTTTDIMNVPPPVLDATWQSFIEQLGF